MSKYLIHYGTSGMKRGVRLFQFKDGTWTSLGKERRRAQYESTGKAIARGASATGAIASAAGSAALAGRLAAKGDDRMFMPGKDGKPSDYSKIVKEGSNIQDEFMKSYNSFGNNSRGDYNFDDLTDDQLNQIKMRLELERRVSELLEEDYKQQKKAQIHLDDVLRIVGGLSSIGLSIATIYSLVRGNKAKAAKEAADAAAAAEKAAKK